NYTLLLPGADGRFGTKDDVKIPITKAAYNSTAHTVTLSPAHNFGLHQTARLKVNGMAPQGLASATGVLLDRANNGMPGSTDVATFRALGGGPFGPHGSMTKAPNQPLHVFRASWIRPALHRNAASLHARS